MKNAGIKELLKNTIKADKIVNGYIFSGSGNTKNYEYAKEFSKMILCLEPEEGSCGKCKSCIMFEDDNNPDYFEINKEQTDSIKIDEIREMQEKIIEKPIISKKKVYKNFRRTTRIYNNNTRFKQREYDTCNNKIKMHKNSFYRRNSKSDNRRKQRKI